MIQQILGTVIMKNICLLESMQEMTDAFNDAEGIYAENLCKVLGKHFPVCTSVYWATACMHQNQYLLYVKIINGTDISSELLKSFGQRLTEEDISFTKRNNYIERYS